MNDPLQALYQEVIVDHNRNPRHFHALATANRTAEGYNPLCGDKVFLYLQIDDNRITDLSFTGDGCAISVASASLMTECLLGKTLEEAESLFQRFHRLLTDEQHDDSSDLGKLAVLQGVKAFPVRVKCATLVWHTLQAALHNEKEATTE